MIEYESSIFGHFLSFYERKCHFQGKSQKSDFSYDPLSCGLLNNFWEHFNTFINKAHSWVLVCLTGEEMYFITNLCLSVFKANQWNSSPKNTVKFHDFQFFHFLTPVLANRLLCQPQEFSLYNFNDKCIQMVDVSLLIVKSFNGHMWC